jgi:plasmid stabilization system protein ParE
MAYRVNFTRRARRDYFLLYDSIHAAESDPAQLWFRRLDETIALLATAPRMGSVTHEDKTVRQVIYGNKPHLYRVLYDIDDADHRVDILSIWHGKRLPPTFFKA